MRVLIVALLLVAAFAKHPVNQEIVDEIKRSAKLWQPSEVADNYFNAHTEESIISMMGTKIDLERDVEKANELGLTGFNIEPTEAVPADFDSREAWSECPFDIKDQGQCGSCWAFGAVETLEDRLCIKSEGAFIADLSEQNVVSCDYVGFGCSGGWPISAFGYLSLVGTPTEECVPYTSGQSGEAWGCSYSCEDETVSNKRHTCKYPWINFTTKGIKNEIAARGPVETGFSVYEDFINYKSGIYSHTTGKNLGGHAVKIMGWGVEEGEY
jgi:cathepsin B